MTKINGNVLTIPGFTVGLQQDTAIAPLGSFVSASNLVPLLGSRMGIRGGSRVVNTLHHDGVPDAQELGDTFTGAGDVVLSAHTPSGVHTSYTWALGTYTTCSQLYVLETGGYAYLRDTPSTGAYPIPCVGVASLEPTDPDYTVVVDVTFPLTTSVTHTAGVFARGASTGGACYRLYGDTAAGGTLTLDVINAAGVVQDSDSTAFTWTGDVEFTLTLECVGDAIIGYVDGAPIVSLTDATLTDAGHAGLMGNRSANGGTGIVQLDDFNVSLTTVPSTEVDHIPRIAAFSPVGMAVVSWSDDESKHYVTRMTTDGAFYTGTESTSRTDLTASPSTAWDEGPARPTLAELWEKLFLADGTVDYSDRNTFLSLDGSGVVLEPHFAFDGGASQALKPYCLEEFNNVLFLAGYGDETVGDRPEMVRHSFLGSSPDAADGFDPLAWIMIGAKGQRVTAMCKGDTAMLVAKTNELYRISGYGRRYAGWQYEVEHIQQSLGLGCFGPYALCFAQGYWYGVGQNGPFRTDGVDVQALRGPRENAWALVSSPEAFSVDYHPDRGLVIFSVRQATGLPEGLYLSNGVVTPPQETYPNVLWLWDLNRDCWTSDWGFNQQFFHVKAIPTITTQSPQGTPTALPGTAMTTSGYTGNWINGDATAETEFYEKAGVGGSFAVVGTAGDGDVFLIRTGRSPHTRYFYYLMHLKGGIRSTASSTIEVLTLIDPPVFDAFVGTVDPTQPSYFTVTTGQNGLTLTIESSGDGIAWSFFATQTNFPAGTTTYNSFPDNVYYRGYLSDPDWTPVDSAMSNEVFLPAPS